MPQSGEKGGWNPKMVHAGNNLVALGRSRGFRIALLSQRPAKLHKDSLTQVQTLVAMCVVAPQDRDAIHNWIKGQGSPEKEKEIMASLASLNPGRGWVWSPRAGVLDCAQFPMPKTFDSSKAPEFEEKEGSAPVLVPVKMDEIKSRLGKVELDRKANDPKELKARIRELETQLSKNDGQFTMTPARVAEEKKASFEEGVRAAEKVYAPSQRSMKESLERIAKDASQSAEGYVVVGAGTLMRGYGASAMPLVDAKIVGKALFSAEAKCLDADPGRYMKGLEMVQNAPAPKQNASSGGGQRRILIALAQVAPAGLTTKTLASRAGMAQSGSFRTYLSGLTTSGYITRGSEIAITQEGLAYLGPVRAVAARPGSSRLLVESSAGRDQPWSNPQGDRGCARTANDPGRTLRGHRI